MGSKRQRQRGEAASAPTAPTFVGPRPEPLSKRVRAFLETHSRAVAIAAVLLATVRIVATYPVLSHTSDEPAHVACGMEYLDKGAYTWEPQHPPLSRVAAALGPYLIGDRSANTPRKGGVIQMFWEGAAILEQNNQYDKALALARAGELPFFGIACLVIYLWGCRYLGKAVGAVAVVFFTFAPTVLAHAGLATTDIALTAFLSATFLAGRIWLEAPTLRNTVWFGVSAGLMVLSKFSCVVFFPAAIVLALLWYYLRTRPDFPTILSALKERIPTFALAVVIGFLLVWAGYRFSVGKVHFTSLRMPFPELWAGLDQVREHNAKGHQTYFLGEVSGGGYWDFFLVALLVKTPIGMLGLIATGVALAFRKRAPFTNLFLPLAFSGGVLLVGIFSKINIGLRHVLPVYVGFSLLAAFAALHLLEAGNARKWMSAACAICALWFMGSSLLAHPDYLPYFNEFAGSHPENILVDSDLDWGQDQRRLGWRLKELGVTRLAFRQYIVGNLQKDFGFPPVDPIDRRGPVVGWNAASLVEIKQLGMVPWAEKVPPLERVGKTILLWNIAPPPGSRPPTPIAPLIK